MFSIYSIVFIGVSALTRIQGVQISVKADEKRRPLLSCIDATDSENHVHGSAITDQSEHRAISLFVDDDSTKPIAEGSLIVGNFIT